MRVEDELRTLEGVSPGEIHEAFAEAFRDYIVPLTPSREQLEEMLVRRGWRPDLSVGALRDGRLEGFVLNGLRGAWGYNSGTGVVPAARRRRLATNMMRRSAELLRRAGARHYVLEVIEANHPARELYRREGFHDSRRLQCWSLQWDGEAAADALRDPDWEALRRWWDVEPSWQNATDSIHAARWPFVLLGDDSAYVVLFPSSGDVAQLAVAPSQRRRGHGRRLLQAAAALARKPLRILNVDASAASIEHFLAACGARKTVAQIEMVAALA